MKTRLAALAVAAALLALAACGEKSEDVAAEPEPLSLTLDSRPGPNHAAIYMAQKLGHFRDAGLELSIRTPPGPAGPIGDVAGGGADLAVSAQPKVILAHERGLDAVAVGTLVDTGAIPARDDLVLVAARERLERDAKPVRLFLAALARGAAAAAEHPNAATEVVLAANRKLKRRATGTRVRATLPLLRGERPGRPYGHMDPARWEELAASMRDRGLISSRPAASRLLSNEYLPGEIPE